MEDGRLIFIASEELTTYTFERLKVNGFETFRKMINYFADFLSKAEYS